MTTTTDPERLTEKQRRVLDAALEVFAERGYAAASTSEIAKRAGVAEGTIFRHYKTKKELLLGVVGPLFFRMLAPSLIEEVLLVVERDYASFEDLVRALYRNRLAFVRKHARVARVVLQELPFHPELRALVVELAEEKVLPRVLPVIRRYQERGEVIDAEPTSVLRVAASLMVTYTFLRFVVAPERAWDDEAELELNVKVVVDGLRPR